jgi:hypothetical protein
MVSKFKETTGTSQFNFKDHADPVLACKPTLDGSMLASGAADCVVGAHDFGFNGGCSFLSQVVLRQILRPLPKSRKEKVILLGHSAPITETLFTNDVRHPCTSES